VISNLLKSLTLRNMLTSNGTNCFIGGAKTLKLADMLARTSTFNTFDGIAVNVVCPFMALLSFRGYDTPS